MRNENGISIILADSQLEVDKIMDVLGLTDVYEFRSVTQNFLTDPEAVFYVILKTKDEMIRFTEILSVRRGVISANGKRESIGFNVDWMKKIMAKSKADTARILKAALPVGFSNTFEGLAEKDDPHADLGYRR
jgi:hypothetical protein